jgi:RNA polymerase sigma-70 factor (ECF subfamily)
VSAAGPAVACGNNISSPAALIFSARFVVEGEILTSAGDRREAGGMNDRFEPSRESAGVTGPGEPMSAPDLAAWFSREVLPLEAVLTQFLSRNWRNQSDIVDLRQEVYVRICEMAQKELPYPVRPLLFSIARNLLVDRIRKTNVVPSEAVSDLDALGIAVEPLTPDRTVAAREEIRRLQDAMERLPPRCREAVALARLDGLSGKEIALRMNISEATASYHLNHGVRLLANMLYGEPTDHRRRK